MRRVWLAETDEVRLAEAVARLRSRRGFQTAYRRGLLSVPDRLARALPLAHHPVTVAYLLPFALEPRGFPVAGYPDGRITEILSTILTRVAPGSARHVALAEAARRLYKRSCMLADRQDKLAAGGSR
ncbi:MAG: hypothetical protein HY720_24685 [Planctomycetes bacterium]|nr:hypothetical protein [Planctomycetota bacterium]